MDKPIIFLFKPIFIEYCEKKIYKMYMTKISKLSESFRKNGL